MSLRSKFIFSLCVFFLFSYTSLSLCSAPSSLNTIRVTTYNVENLFDSTHDEGKADWTFLAKNTPGKNEYCTTMREGYYKEACFRIDWTAERVQWKLEQIKKVFSKNADMPDILGLQEVENERVLSALAGKLAYGKKYILEEGPDKRGIDCALLYKEDKLKYLSHRSHRLYGPEFVEKPTRDILVVFFRPKNAKAKDVLAVYVNHWPSQAARASKRVATAKKLQEFIRKDQEEFGEENFHAIVIGDFNTIPADHPHPFKSVLLVGDSALYDVQEFYKVAPEKKVLGTYFYPRKMTWQYLDKIFVNAKLRDGVGMEVLGHSFHIHSDPHITHTYHYKNKEDFLFGSKVNAVPWRYNPMANSVTESGYSDHFPLSVLIRL